MIWYMILLVVVYIVALLLFHVYVRWLGAGRENFNVNCPSVVIDPWYCPFLGPIFSMLDIEAALKKWRAKYGDKFTVLIFGRYLTFVTKYSDLKIYYNASEETLSLSRAGQFIVGSSYPEHQYMTQFDTIPYLHRILSRRYLNLMISNIESIMHDCFNIENGRFWLENGDEMTVDLFDFMYRLILRTNSMNFVSRRVYENHVEELIELYSILDVEKNALNPIVQQFKRQIGFKSERDTAWQRWIEILMPDIERYLQMIDKHVENEDFDTLYQTVQYAKNELEKRGQRFTPRLVAYLVFTTFFPAQFNTYITAAFLILEWIRHKDDEIGQRIEGEITGALSQAQLTIESFDSMEYLQACIYEVIRLRIDSQLSLRYAGKDLPISDGKYIPSGNLVGISLTRHHHLQDDTDEFRPERHLRARAESKSNPSQAAPFGRGKHPCTGEKYVKMQIQLLLIQFYKFCRMEIMAQSIDFEATINRKQLIGLSRPNKPVFVKISKKNQWHLFICSMTFETSKKIIQRQRSFQWIVKKE